MMSSERFERRGGAPNATLVTDAPPEQVAYAPAAATVGVAVAAPVPAPVLVQQPVGRVRYATVVTPKPDATASALVWFFILLIIIIVIVAIIVWIIKISFPGTHNDVTMRDLCARDVRASKNSIVGRNLTVGCRARLQSAIATVLAIEPIVNEALNIEMSGKISSIVMTNASTTPVTVTLPSGEDAPAGMIVILSNTGGAASFVVQPTGTDTLNSGTTPITVTTQSAMFYNMGNIPNLNVVNWTRLA
jgi:hypothetical protein